jgi:riboflavin kinase/FMN adenylyltransferase
MRIFRSFGEASCIRNPVVTTGSFDGVHIGHKTILNRLKMLAEKSAGESVLITFDPHPRKVLYPETRGKDLKLISSKEEKLMLLENAGLDNVIIVNFTIAFSKITSEEFVREYLHNTLHARVVVVGFNHHFGFNKEGDYRQLWGWQEKYDFQAEEIPEQEVYHESVSSTKIRQAISEGYIQKANAYLDHYYLIKGPVMEYNHKVLGNLTRVSITDESKLIPPQGIYAASVNYSETTSKAMVIIHQDQVLADIFCRSVQPGTVITLSFHKKMNPAISLSDPALHQKLMRSRDEISELIY